MKYNIGPYPNPDYAVIVVQKLQQTRGEHFVSMQKQSKAKQRCVMGVGMCLYAQLVQTKNT